MSSNIYSVTTIYGLAILPMVVLLIPPIKKFLLKMANDYKDFAYSIPIYVWLIFMSDLGESIFEKVMLWGAVIFFLFIYATMLATFSNKSLTNESKI